MKDTWQLLLVGLAVAVWAVSLAGAAACQAAQRPRVEYDPPWLSVDAREASLLEVLELIGEKVGFAVVDGGGSASSVTLSIGRALLDEVLRQLLRAEDHTIVYRQAGAGALGIDTIIVSSRSAPRLPGPSAPAPPPRAIVADRLKSQALVVAPSRMERLAEGPPLPAPGVRESLAITTRQARQDLDALMRGLRATDQLQAPTAGIE